MADTQRVGIVYCCTSKTTGKKYVGQTLYILSRRISGHRCTATKGGKSAFHAAIRKYGIEDFTIEVVEAGIPENILDERERHWIAGRDTMSPQGYNLTDGGSGSRPTAEVRAKLSASRKGRVISPEWRAALSRAGTGKKQSPETISKRVATQTGQKRPSITGEKHVGYGKSLSPEAKQKMSIAAKKNMTPERRALLSEKSKGKTLSAESRRKLSRSLTGLMAGEKNPMYGTKKSEDEKRSLSLKLKGIPKSAGHREKIAEALKGRVPTWLIGKKQSEETKRKRSASMKAVWAKKHG